LSEGGVNDKTAIKGIERTASGLSDAMFETLELLKAGKITANDAKAAASIAMVILKGAEVRLLFEQLRQQSEIPQHLSDMALVPPLKQIEVKR